MGARRGKTAPSFLDFVPFPDRRAGVPAPGRGRGRGGMIHGALIPGAVAAVLAALAAEALPAG